MLGSRPASLRLPVEVLVGALLAALCLGACSSGSDQPASKASGDGSGRTGRTAPEPTAGERAVRRMTLRQKAGQVIVASWAGTASPAPLVRRLHLGGVIAFTDNVTSPDQIRAVNRSVRRVVARRGYPAFVGVDQEGGLVERVGAPSTSFPAFMTTGAAHDTALTRRAARAGAAEMRGLGFDVVFAPVADVSAGDRDAVIGSRAAGGRPALVAQQVVAAARGIEDAGVLPVVKHFPGHGSLSSDSHLALPVQTRSPAQLRRTDLVPFAAAVAAHVPAILTGHIDVRALDRGVPASISRKVTTGLLRRRMGYDGLVVTDALDMQGVQRVAPGARASVRALRAGADVLLMPPDPQAARDAIVRAVRGGHLSRARLDEAAAAMIDTLRSLPDRSSPRSDRAERVGAGRGAAYDLARRSITSVAGPCSGRLVADRVRVVGEPSDVADFDATMAARGVTIAHDYTKRVRSGSRVVVVGHRTTVVKKKVEVKKKVVVKKIRKQVPIRERRPVYKQVRVTADAPTVALVGSSGGTPGPADITVALDRPGVLGRVGSRVELATYGDVPASMSALADVLLGRATAPGRLPIDVPGAERAGC